MTGLGGMRGDTHNLPVSVAVTTLDDGQLLLEALRSIGVQETRPDQVIVVDDGSDPPTAPEAIQAFSNTSDLRVEYVWQENQGPSAARNAGLARARSEYIAFLDADDLWRPGHLRLKWERMEALGETYSTVYDAFVEFDGETGRRLRTIATGTFDGPISEAPLGLPGGVPAGMPFQMHRVDALRRVGGFDPTLRVNEDFDLLLRLAREGYWICGSDQVTVERRVHASSLTRKNPEDTFAHVERFLDKAQREGLLPPPAVASRRKWARLSLGRSKVNAEDNGTALEALAQFRDAFAFDSPRGLPQWGAYLASRSNTIGVPLIHGYRFVRCALGRRPPRPR